MNWQTVTIITYLCLTTIGDVFGQALSNLNDLVSMPIGCGEQNMITTVPNVFGMDYIYTTNQQGLENVLRDMLGNMKKGENKFNRY